MTLALLALTALPFVVSPGASFAITVDATSKGDLRAPTKVWAGTSVGIVAVASAAALSGIGSFLDDQPTVRQMFTVVGGAVLMVLGITSGVRAVRSIRRPMTALQSSRGLIPWAFIALVTNVKALTLYIVVVPHLRGGDLGTGALVPTFAAVHILMLLVWQALLGQIIRRIPRLSTSPPLRACLAGLASASLIAMGAQVLVSVLP
nr:LysE family transporter [Clavibacter michiganensis]